MPQPAPQLYSSQAGRRQIEQLYDRVLAGLPFPAHELTVTTPTFGAVHVTVGGKEDGPPLVLWQGAGTPGPHMLRMCAPLAEHYRIYAPDTPCHGGRSAEVLLDQATHEWGRWSLEVMEALGLLRKGAPIPLHAGVSMGGCTLLDLAVVAPETIRGAALIVPGSLHPDYGSRWHSLCLSTWLFLPMMLYCLAPCRWTAWVAMWGMMDDTWQLLDDPITQHLLLMFRYCRYWAQAPGRMEAEQLAGLKTPVLVIAGEKDIFGGGAATAARAPRVLPDCTAEVVPGAKHCFNTARMNAACERAVQFFCQRCGV